MKLVTLCLLLTTLTFTGCSNKSKNPANVEAIMAASAIVDQEVATVSAELNSIANYELSAEEIELLEKEKLLKDGDAKELAKLIK